MRPASTWGTASTMSRLRRPRARKLCGDSDVSPRTFATWRSFESPWHRFGGDAIDGRILDPAVRRAGGSRFPGVPGQRAGHQESTGPQERRAREPVAAEVAHVRTAAELVSPLFGDPRAAYVLAA